MEELDERHVAMKKNETMVRLMGVWEDVRRDLEATVEEYREAGWTVVDLAPGDVTLTTDDQYDIDVLVPDNEFEDVLEAIEEGDYRPTETDRFSTVANGLVIHLLVVKDTRNRIAITFPIYFNERPEDRVVRIEDETEPATIGLRNLNKDFVLTIEYDSFGEFFDEV